MLKRLAIVVTVALIAFFALSAIAGTLNEGVDANWLRTAAGVLLPVVLLWLAVLPLLAWLRVV